jgi:site-specific DNA recombinase
VTPSLRQRRVRHLVTLTKGALPRLDPIRDGLFTTEQARLLQLLVERVDVLEDGLELRLKATGLASLVAELRPHSRKQAA